MKKENESPCICCQRVPEPKKCDNKECKYWRAWFLQSWERTRQQFAKADHTPDPCDSCVCPRALCFSPCEERKRWEVAR